MVNEYDPKAMKSGLERRMRQLDDLKFFVDTRDNFNMQINFSVPKTEDHCCITVSGKKVPELADHVISIIDSQIKAMKAKQQDQERMK